MRLILLVLPPSIIIGLHCESGALLPVVGVDLPETDLEGFTEGGLPLIFSGVRFSSAARFAIFRLDVSLAFVDLGFLGEVEREGPFWDCKALGMGWLVASSSSIPWACVGPALAFFNPFLVFCKLFSWSGADLPSMSWPLWLGVPCAADSILLLAWHFWHNLAAISPC